MKSKTKYYLSDTDIDTLFLNAGLGKVQSYKNLDDGEFNSAYTVSADGKEYVLKIAPKPDADIMTYEKNLMESEVYFYKQIEEKTRVKIPKVYCFDKSLSIIPSPYFIMEKLKSMPLTKCKLSKAEKAEAYSKVGETVAHLHTIKGEGFGYIQNGLKSDWYSAIKSMVNNLIEDCRRKNKKLKAGVKLLEYIETYKNILMKVKPTYTHFDIWDGNIFYEMKYGEAEISLIDTERGFWGDGIGDFVSIEMFSDLENKKSVESYNKSAVRPITFTTEELIRFNILRAYLGLIVYSERYMRYDKYSFKYLLNRIMASYLYKNSFKVLKRLKNV